MLRKTVLHFLAGVVLLGGQAFASPNRDGQPLSSDRMLSHMTKMLSLTDAQSQQIKPILDSHQAQMASQFQALQAAREALQQAASATPVNEGAIRNAATALAQAEGDAALLHAQVHAQILPVLTPDQQKKFATLRKESHPDWKSRGSAR